jgi:hypothetical protein
MSDKNVINISPETVMIIEQYQNDGKNKNVQLNILEGKVRAGVEQKYDGEKNRFNIKTPSAVAGVRGTDFLTSYSSASKVSQVITFSGTVAVGTAGPNGRIENPVFVKPGQMTSTGADGKPAAPSTVPKEQLNEVKQESNAETAKKEPQKNEKVETKEEVKEEPKDKKEEPKEQKKTDSSENSESSNTASKDEILTDNKKTETSESKAESNTDTRSEAKTENKTDNKAEPKPEPKNQTENKTEKSPDTKMDSKSASVSSNTSESAVTPKPETAPAPKQETAAATSKPNSETPNPKPSAGNSAATNSTSTNSTSTNSSGPTPAAPAVSPAAATPTNASPKAETARAPAATPPTVSMIIVKDLGPSLSTTINVGNNPVPKVPVVNIPIPAIVPTTPSSNQIVNEIIKNTKSRLNITIIKQP